MCIRDRKKGRAGTAVARKRRVELHPGSRGFGVGLPAPQTDRHRMAGRWRSRTPSLIGTLCRRSSLTTAWRVAGGGGAWCVGSGATAEMSVAGGGGSRGLNNAVVEGGSVRGADSCRRRRGARAAARCRDITLERCNRQRRRSRAQRGSKCHCVTASPGYTGRRTGRNPSRRGCGRGR